MMVTYIYSAGFLDFFNPSPQKCSTNSGNIELSIGVVIAIYALLNQTGMDEHVHQGQYATSHMCII